MSHELYASDRMAYRLLGGDPWHIQETRSRCKAVGEFISGSEMQKAAGLDYSLEKVSVRPVDTESIVRGLFAIRRTDTRECLSGTGVGKVYEILQPSKMFDFGDAIRETDPGSQWETAGSLFGGRRIWGLIRLNGETTVNRSGRRAVEKALKLDKSAPYALVSTTFDGTQRTIVQHTSIRVVCWNTMSAAFEDKSAQYAIRHTGTQEARMKEAAKALGHAIEWQTEWSETAQKLADTGMTNKEARTFFAMLLTETETPDEAAEIYTEYKGRKLENFKETGGLLVELFNNGTGNLGQDRYDALNAVTEYVDRERARIRQFKGKTQAMRLDSALDSSQFGNGAKMKQRAVRLLTRW